MMQVVIVFFIFFFFKQKTAYEMSVSDWSSDVCSSDLGARCPPSRARRAGGTPSGDRRPRPVPVREESRRCGHARSELRRGHRMNQDPIRQKIRKRLDDGTLPREVPLLTKSGWEQPGAPPAHMKADSAIGLSRCSGCDAGGAQVTYRLADG